MIEAINKLQYLSKHPIKSGSGSCSFFDTASIGLVSNKIKEKEKEVEWSLIVNDIKDNFSKIINVDSSEISIFHNTISAIERIFTQLKNFECFVGSTLLTTDVEFPSVYAAMNEIWKESVCIVRISHIIYDKNLQPKEKDRQILYTIQTAIRTVRPSVIYISHVLRGSGYIVNIEKISHFSKSILPYIFFITDGAQAIGNIEVDIRKQLKDIDAYVTSGHKWLCGPQHIGLLYSKERWMMDDPAHSYSLKVNTSGTGNKPLLIKFNQSLLEFFPSDPSQLILTRMRDIEVHNRKLSKIFRKDILETDNFEIVNMCDENISGIVVFKPINGTLDINRLHMPDMSESNKEKKDKKDKKKEENKKNCISYGTISTETINFNPWIKTRLRFIIKIEKEKVQIQDIRDFFNIPIERQWFRVCFHLYHNEKDVNRLVNIFNSSYQKSNVLTNKGKIKQKRKK